jgi:hypothetical protein
MELSTLAQNLADSRLSQAAEAVAAIRRGWKIEAMSESGTCEELASAYQLRLANLRNKSSPHAVQLAASTEELVVSLQKNFGSIYKWVSIGGDAEFKFAIVCLAESGKVLGCLRTVSQLDVSPKRWSDIWHEA